MKRLIPVLGLVLLLSGCSSTYITSSWKAENAALVPFKRLVVIALVGESEKAARQLMEKHAVDDLKELGYNAVCSCEEYDPAAFKGMSEKEAVDKLRREGVDGILTIVLLDKRKEKVYVPARPATEPAFWNYYQTMHNRVYAKGYYTEDTKYFWESNLYNLSGDQLLYAVKSQSFDPATTESLAHEYGKKIIGKMIKQKVLAKQTEQRPLRAM